MIVETDDDGNTLTFRGGVCANEDEHPVGGDTMPVRSQRGHDGTVLVALDGFEVMLMRGEDGTMLVQIDTPCNGPDIDPDGSPRCRVYLNDDDGALYEHPEYVPSDGGPPHDAATATGMYDHD